MSLAKHVLESGKPFTFFHTWTVSEGLLSRAIREGKSMDLDVSVDDAGEPYLGHSREYHEKSGEPYFQSLPLWAAVERIDQAGIAAMVDCKHYGAVSVIEEVISRIGPERTRVDSFVSEFKFGHSRADGEPDFLTEWMPAATLLALKERFPSVTTAACVKWPPSDLLTSSKYAKLVEFIREVAKQHRVDLICLSVPDRTITDDWLRYFLAEDILLCVGIDRADTAALTLPYIGETDDLALASYFTTSRPTQD